MTRGVVAGMGVVVADVDCDVIDRVVRYRHVDWHSSLLLKRLPFPSQPPYKKRRQVRDTGSKYHTGL